MITFLSIIAFVVVVELLVISKRNQELQALSDSAEQMTLQSKAQEQFLKNMVMSAYKVHSPLAIIWGLLKYPFVARDAKKQNHIAQQMESIRKNNEHDFPQFTARWVKAILLNFPTLYITLSPIVVVGVMGSIFFRNIKDSKNLVDFSLKDFTLSFNMN